MAEKISKSEQKRRFKQMEEAAQELSQLSASDVARLPVTDVVKEEIAACYGLKGGARKRQVKYLAKVLREEDGVEEAFAYLARHKGSKLKENKLHHEAERLRDLLVSEVLEFQQQAQQERQPLTMDWPGTELAGLVGRFEIGEKALRQALYQYARSRAQNNYREVFRMIKAALEKEERGSLQQ